VIEFSKKWFYVPFLSSKEKYNFEKSFIDYIKKIKGIDYDWTSLLVPVKRQKKERPITISHRYNLFR